MNHRIKPDVVEEIRGLLRAKAKANDIAELVGVSDQTVRRIRDAMPVEELRCGRCLLLEPHVCLPARSA